MKTEDRLLAELPNGDRKSVPRERPSECPQNAFTTPRNLAVAVNFWGFNLLGLILIIFTMFLLYNFEFERKIQLNPIGFHICYRSTFSP